jgi:hypothetical protein
MEAVEPDPASCGRLTIIKNDEKPYFMDTPHFAFGSPGKALPMTAALKPGLMRFRLITFFKRTRGRE